MARRSRQSATPRDNDSLAGLFGMDFFPSEGSIAGDDDGIVRTAQRIVEHSGISNLIDQWSAEDRGDKRAGPKPWLSEVQVVTLMLVLTLSRRAPLFTEMRGLLRQADPSTLALLGIETPEGISDTALYHRAYNSYRRLVRVMNPEPGSLYRVLTKAEVAQRLAERNAEKSRLHRERAHAFSNAVLWGTWMLLPREVRRKMKGDIALDATVIQAAARGRSSRSPWASSDPEAGWYKRDGNHDGTATSRAATKYQRRTDSLIWGRELHTAVTHGDNVPVIVLSATFDRPGKRLAENALGCVDALLGRGVPAGHFVSDRAYLPGTKAPDLALPLRAKGYRLVFDYDRTRTSLGVQASHAGAILVEGQWYCPSMPEPLRDASIDFFLRDEGDACRISQQTYQDRLKQREPYALHVKQRPDAEGFVRLQCPAVGASATVKCPRKQPHPRSEDRPLTRIQVPLLVAPSPQVCEQKTLTIPPSSGAKYEQTYAYRSADWEAHYITGRQSVESMNKSIKDARFAPVDEPESRPRRGWIAQLLSLVVLVAASNVRKIVAWLYGHVGVSRIAAAPVRRKRRREATQGWTSVPNAPPLAAEA
jgi:hypothetical protein